MTEYEPFLSEFFASNRLMGESYFDGANRTVGGWYCVPDFDAKRMRVYAYHNNNHRYFDGLTCREDAQRWIRELMT